MKGGTVATAIKKDKFIISYKCLNRLTGFIKRHEDINPSAVCNHVIYIIDCMDCDASYLGQTKRRLKSRIEEYKKTVNKVAIKHSVITDHILHNNYDFDWDNTVILDSELNYYKRLMN